VRQAEKLPPQRLRLVRLAHQLGQGTLIREIREHPRGSYVHKDKIDGMAMMTMTMIIIITPYQPISANLWRPHDASSKATTTPWLITMMMIMMMMMMMMIMRLWVMIMIIIIIIINPYQLFLGELLEAPRRELGSDRLPLAG
jgi:hypothetical protein